jgi:signal peptidase II
VFYLKFGFNTGSAFSFLRDESWARYFFITVTFLALGYMGWLAWKMPTKRLYGFIAVGLIAAGAAGNLHDRFVRVMPVWMDGKWVEAHGVVDFLQFYYNWDGGKYWPIFNVADSSLVCGVGLLLVYLHFHGAEDEPAAKERAKDQGEPAPDQA